MCSVLACLEWLGGSGGEVGFDVFGIYSMATITNQMFNFTQKCLLIKSV